MSVSLAESELKRSRVALEDARKKQAAEERKAADSDKAAASKEQSAARSSSASSARNYLREAQRKRDDANKARAKAADHSGKAATAQVKVHAAEAKLAKAQAAEQDKRLKAQAAEQKKHDAQAKREQSRREADERSQREEAARMAQQAAWEHQRAEQVRAEADAARDRRLAEVDADVATTRAVIESRPWEVVPEKVTVLLITAQPDETKPLKIDREIREIQERVRSSEMRDSIHFEYRPATRVTDLLQHLNEVAPDVLHFSGHGADAGIALHDASDKVRLLSNEELDRLLELAPRPLKLVIFNSCKSAEQARVAVRHANAAIGMEQSVGDETARVFAGQLYNSLGFGRSLGLAFDHAKFQVQLTLDRISGDPTLVMAEGIDAHEFTVVSPAVVAEPARDGLGWVTSDASDA